MEYTSLVERDRFERLIEEWKWQTDNIQKMSDSRDDTAAAINRVFGLVVTEEKLLADLPWTLFFYNRETNTQGEGYLTCQYDDDRTREFLGKLIWKTSHYHYSHKLVVNGTEISFDDREISVSFDNIEAVIAFCKEQGIRPNVATLNDQRREAQQRADFFSRVTTELAPTLAAVAFERLQINDRLIGANGVEGTIYHLDPGSYHSGGETYTGWMNIRWDNGKCSEMPHDDGNKIIYLGQ